MSRPGFAKVVHGLDIHADSLFPNDLSSLDLILFMPGPGCEKLVQDFGFHDSRFGFATKAQTDGDKRWGPKEQVDKIFKTVAEDNMRRGPLRFR